MQNILSQNEIQSIEEQLKHFESVTGCDLLLVVTKSCDDYPGAVWRFSFLGGIFLILIFSVFFDFAHSYYWPLLMLVLVSLLIQLAARCDFIKRLALSNSEVDRECFEKAVVHFYKLGVSKVGHKVTAMITLSLLEKKIVVLIDEHLKTKLTQQELDELVSMMKFSFKKGAMKEGIINAIQQLQKKIRLDFSGKVSNATQSELSDHIHFV